jgi:single-stranded DNA-binding protein
LTSTSTSDVALTGVTGTNPSITPTISVSRVVKTFTIASNTWTFVS